MIPHRPGPVYERLDPFTPKELAKAVAMRRPHYVVLEAVEVSRFAEVRQPQIAHAGQGFAIETRDPTAMRDPLWKMAKLHVEDRGVDVVEQRRVAVHVEFAAFSVFAVEAQQSDHPRDVRVVRRHRAPVAEPTQRLERVEAEASTEAE